MKLRTVAVLMALSTVAGVATAGEIKPFKQVEFDRLTRSGQSVVVDVRASWCPTCRAQKPILQRLMQRPAYKNVTLLTVDYDSERSTLREFKVAMQSTVIGFKGPHEVGRSIGDTTEAGLNSLIQKTVQ